MKMKKVIIIIAISLVLATATTIILIVNTFKTPNNPDILPRPQSDPTASQSIIDPIGQNVLDYQIEEKPAPQMADPNDGYPRQLTLVQFNHLPNGNVEIKIQADLKHTSDKKASCRLILNGQEYLTEKVEINKQFASCRPLIIHESDIKNGSNTYEVFYQANDYKDRYAGEITKR